MLHPVRRCAETMTRLHSHLLQSLLINLGVEAISVDLDQISFIGVAPIMHVSNNNSNTQGSSPNVVSDFPYLMEVL